MEMVETLGRLCAKASLERTRRYQSSFFSLLKVTLGFLFHVLMSFFRVSTRAPSSIHTPFLIYLLVTRRPLCSAPDFLGGLPTAATLWAVHQNDLGANESRAEALPETRNLASYSDVIFVEPH